MSLREGQGAVTLFSGESHPPRCSVVKRTYVAFYRENACQAKIHHVLEHCRRTIRWNGKNPNHPAGTTRRLFGKPAVAEWSARSLCNHKVTGSNPRRGGRPRGILSPRATDGGRAAAKRRYGVQLTHPPSDAEVCLEIRRLKRFKAAGLDGLLPELFEYGGVAIINQLTALFAKIWHEEKVSSSWGESVIVPIFKEGARTSCANHRRISLISVVTNILASILLRRLSPVRESYYREEQAGFRPGRECMDQIFTLRQLLEHRHIYHRPAIVAFLDIRAAFDSVDRPALWRCMLKNCVPEKYTAILRALYLHTSGKVRVYGKLSSHFAVNSGVRQGYPMSPFLFNFAIEDVLSNALEGFQHFGLELLPGERATDLDYADDITLFGDDPRDMQLILDRLAVEASKYGMSFAPSKCKVLLNDWLSPAPMLTFEGAQLEQVDSFVYLGNCVSADGTINKEVSLCIAKVRSAFVKLRHLWRRRDVSFSLKTRVYSASVRSVLLYGCESWPIRVEDMRRLSAFDNGCLKRIAHVSWQHRVNSSDVRRCILGDAFPSTNWFCCAS
ncbi:unnamed protein product [Dicrocoelium dendriticum]|nr:unnamed protein product [Dicrocoelium dendriticum]